MFKGKGAEVKQADTKDNSKTLTFNQKFSNIKCFRCLRTEHFASQYLNKKIMLLKDDSDIESASECDNDGSMPLL